MKVHPFRSFLDDLSLLFVVASTFSFLAHVIFVEVAPEQKEPEVPVAEILLEILMQQQVHLHVDLHCTWVAEIRDPIAGDVAGAVLAWNAEDEPELHGVPQVQMDTPIRSHTRHNHYTGHGIDDEFQYQDTPEYEGLHVLLRDGNYSAFRASLVDLHNDHAVDDSDTLDAWGDIALLLYLEMDDAATDGSAPAVANREHTDDAVVVATIPADLTGTFHAYLFPG